MKLSEPKIQVHNAMLTLEWADWTPTVISWTGGSISGTLITARYIQIAKTVYYYFRWNANGSGNTLAALGFTFPTTSPLESYNTSIGVGREVTNSGLAIQVLYSTTGGTDYAKVQLHNTSTAISNSRGLTCAGQYRVA